MCSYGNENIVRLDGTNELIIAHTKKISLVCMVTRRVENVIFTNKNILNLWQVYDFCNMFSPFHLYIFFPFLFDWWWWIEAFFFFFFSKKRRKISVELVVYFGRICTWLKGYWFMNVVCSVVFLLKKFLLESKHNILTCIHFDSWIWQIYSMCHRCFILCWKAEFQLKSLLEISST